jgi:hypothetical protein
MADISNMIIKKDPTLEKMNEIMQRVHFNNEKIPAFSPVVELSNYGRGYLGASGVGHECEKKVWYDFRFARKEEFNIKTIKRFQSGHFSEELMAYRLRLVPQVKLHTVNGEGGQFGIEDFGGHFSGHLDGAIKGILQAPKTWHVWEHKDSEKIREVEKLKKTTDEKEVLKNWNQVYYAQAQLYMGYTGMTRHYMTVSSPGGRDEISVRTDFSKEDFEILKTKAKKIILADSFESLVQTSEKADFYKCKWCHYNEMCHGQEIAEVNCRTCIHSTAIVEEGGKGKWICEGSKSPIVIDRQRVGCAKHLFNPCFIKNFGVAVEASEDSTWIKYKTDTGKAFYNCTRDSFPTVTGDGILGIFTSIKMCEQQTAILNEVVQKAVSTFDGTVVQSDRPAFDGIVQPAGFFLGENNNREAENAN